MIGYGGSGCKDPRILDPSTGSTSGQLHARILYLHRTGIHWVGGCVDPGTSLNGVKKRNILLLTGLELHHVGRPERSRSLHQLWYLCLYKVDQCFLQPLQQS
jgi:hypothetical protein